MKQIQIREPTQSDTDALLSLIKQLGYFIDANEMRKNILYYSTLSTQKAWVAEKSGKVIGCIAVAITDYFHRKGAFLRVIAIVVNQKYRKKGIGKKLMQMAENYALEMKCSHMELTSGAHRTKLGSHDFYQSMGFVELNELKKYFGKKLIEKKEF